MQSSVKEQPPTNAKIIIFTSHGELEIELWGREAPLAVRNFLQLAIDKYYDNTIFHRLVPGFMIQGGDPTGTGTGGQSIYGSPFKDEPHQRLKFTRRGLVAMANCGKDSNGSQFFITFGECEHLNRKHTIFGRVIGDTIYNLMAMQSIDTDEQDRPTNPPTIRRIKIVLNPFDDIVPRKAEIQSGKTQIKQIQDPGVKKEQMKKLKKKNKLTFDCEQVEQGSKVKSSHEVLKDSKLSSQAAVSQQQLTRKAAEKAEEEEKKRALKERISQLVEAEEEGDNALMDQELKKKRKLNEEREAKVEDEVLNYKTTFNVQTQRNQITWENLQKKKEEERQEQLKQARQKLKQEKDGILADQLNFKKVKEGSHKEKRKMMLGQEIQLLSRAERIRYQFRKKKQQDSKDTNLFDKLNSFTGKLKDVKSKEKNVQWMRHSLKFHIDSQAAYKFDQKKKLVHQGQDDLEDGGLKIEVERNIPEDEQFNVDQLYDMIHQESKEDKEEQ